MLTRRAFVGWLLSLPIVQALPPEATVALDPALERLLDLLLNGWISQSSALAAFGMDHATGAQRLAEAWRLEAELHSRK